LPRTPQGTAILPAEGVSRKAVLGACWASIFFLAGLAYFMARTVVTVPDVVVTPPEPSIAWRQILLMVTVLPVGVTAPFGATILGWLAVSDIRRSQGRISGLRLAVFDGLFFPLMAFNGLLAWLWINAVRAVAEGSGESFATAPWPAIARIGAVVICLIATFDISRRVWRAVRLDGMALPASGAWWWSSKTAGVVLAALCVVVIGLVANRRLPSGRSSHGPAQVAQRDAQTGRLFAKLPGSGTVELLAIGERYGALNGWWAPDGTPLSNSLYEVRGGVDNVMGDRVPKEFLFSATDLPAGASSAGVEAQPFSPSGSGGEVFLNGRRIPGGKQVRLAWDASVKTASIQLGYALDPWRTIATHAARHQSYRHQRLSSDPGWTVHFHHEPIDTKDGAQIALIFGPDNQMWSHRMVALDTNGVEHSYTQGNGTPVEKMTLWTYTFRNLSLAAVKEFQLQVRPVHWVEFRDVALTPNAPLPEPRRAQFGPAKEVTFDEIIDFDTGVVTNFPPDRGGPNPFQNYANLAWMRQRGFDAGAGTGELWPVDVDFTVLDLSDWDDLRESELVERIYRSHFRPGQLKALAEGRLPATFGFRTREGSIGILQLVAFADGKPRATVRYKLVQRAEEPADASAELRLPEVEPGKTPALEAGKTLDELPPVVIRTFPVAGAREVEPGVTEIRATFNKDMTEGSWSWAEAWASSTPSMIDQPRFEADRRTCTLKVKLEPGRTYAWWLNSERYHNFKDTGGRAAVPYLLIFQTKPN
jgi:hypothetical protein